MMSPESGHRMIIACTMVTLAAITWGEVKVNKTAPPPSRYVGAGVLFGMLDVASPVLGDELAATLAVGVTIVLVYRGLGTKASGVTPAGTSTGTASGSGSGSGGSSSGESVAGKVAAGILKVGPDAALGIAQKIPVLGTVFGKAKQGVNGVANGIGKVISGKNPL